MSNFLNKSLAVKTETVRCTANQTKKKAEANKKSAKLKNQEERKASRTFLLCKNTFPQCGNTDQKTGPKTAALRCRANQTERKRQLAKLASKEAGRTHLRGDDSRETKQNSEKTLC